MFFSVLEMNKNLLHAWSYVKNKDDFQLFCQVSWKFEPKWNKLWILHEISDLTGWLCVLQRISHTENNDLFVSCYFKLFLWKSF